MIDVSTSHSGDVLRRENEISIGIAEHKWLF
jgi:hypothetical protein